MTDFYRIVTLSKERVIPSNTEIEIELPDKSYAAVMIKHAANYSGEARTSVKTGSIPLTLEEADAALMKSKGGRFGSYKKEKQRLFDNVDGVYIPKLATVLRGQFPESASIDDLVDEVHKCIQENSENRVERSTVEKWVTGKEETIAPKCWDHFGIMSKISKYPGLSAFEPFFSDFQSFDPEKISEYLVGDNLYFDYLHYTLLRSILGKQSKSESKQKTGGKRRWKKQGKFNLDDFKQDLNEEFREKIDEDFSAEPIILIEKVKPNGNNEKRGKTSKVTAPVQNGIYVVKKGEHKRPNVRRKSIEEIGKDISILERTLLNYVQLVIYDQEPNLDYRKITAIYFNIQEKMRNIQILKDHLGLSRDEERNARESARKIHEKLKDGREADRILGFPIGTFRKLWNSYHLLNPTLPPEWDQHAAAGQNHNILSSLPAPSDNKKLKRYKERLAKLRAKIEEYKEKLTPLAKKMHLKHLPSERVNNYIYFKHMKALRLSKDYSPTLRDMLARKWAYYSTLEIVEVLTRYGLEATIDSNHDIGLLKKSNVLAHIRSIHVIP